MTSFNGRRPAIVVVDDFYTNPNEVRDIALRSGFNKDNRFYKGSRSGRHLFPYVREEFQRLLGAEITDWMEQPFNGCFQLTSARDPLVWHSDTQDYAGAVYLNPESAVQHGTSFWRDKTFGCRRPPPSPQQCAEMYSEHNLLNQDNWELVDKVGAVYNRLVLWDAKMVHSASSYPDFDNLRLVQLFFFNIQ